MKTHPNCFSKSKSMKTRLFTGFLSLLAVGTLLIGCKQTPKDSVSTDIQMYSFAGEGGSKTVTVSASGKWTANPSASWIEITNQTANSFDVTVGVNESGALRDARINITCGTATSEVVIYQAPADTSKWMFRLYNDLHGSVLSPSGKYIGGYYSTVDQATNATVTYAVFIDMATETRTEIGPYTEDALLVNGAWACTDDGKLFLSTASEAVMFDVTTRDYVKLEATGINGLPSLQQVAADNTTWVGWAQNMESIVPVLWQNGSARALPKPDRSYEGGVCGAAVARGISADGAVIYGSTWDSLLPGMVYWTSADNFETCHWAGEDVYSLNEDNKSQVNGLVTWSGQYNINSDGSWIAATYDKKFEDNKVPGTAPDVMYPAFFNTKTGKTTVFTEFGDGSGMTVCGNLGLIGTPSFQTSSGYVVDLETNENLGTVAQWVLDTFGMVIPAGYTVYMPSENVVWGAMTYAPAGMVTVWNWYLGPVVK